MLTVSPESAPQMLIVLRLPTFRSDELADIFPDHFVFGVSVQVRELTVDEFDPQIVAQNRDRFRCAREQLLQVRLPDLKLALVFLDLRDVDQGAFERSFPAGLLHQRHVFQQPSHVAVFADHARLQIPKCPLLVQRREDGPAIGRIEVEFLCRAVQKFFPVLKPENLCTRPVATLETSFQRGSKNRYRSVFEERLEAIFTNGRVLSTIYHTCAVPNFRLLGHDDCSGANMLVLLPTITLKPIRSNRLAAPRLSTTVMPRHATKVTPPMSERSMDGGPRPHGPRTPYTFFQA